MDPATSSSDSFYAVVSPSLFKPEWSDVSRFQLTPAFDPGINREFLDEYTSCLDGIPDISVLLDDDQEDSIATTSSAAHQPPPKSELSCL